MRPASLVSSPVFAFLLYHSFAPVSTCIGSTCKAAADRDRRVNYNFWVWSFHGYPGSDQQDTRGLAKIAALSSVSKEFDVISVIKEQLKKHNDSAKKLALDQCLKLYTDMPLADAYDQINQRHYDAGKTRLNQAINMSHNCAGALEKDGKPSLLSPKDDDSVGLCDCSGDYGFD